jgi:hypothetical protein
MGTSARSASALPCPQGGAPCSASTRLRTAGSSVCATVAPTSSAPPLTPVCVSASSRADARTPAVRSLLRARRGRQMGGTQHEAVV